MVLVVVIIVVMVVIMVFERLSGCDVSSDSSSSDGGSSAINCICGSSGGSIGIRYRPFFHSDQSPSYPTEK